MKTASDPKPTMTVVHCVLVSGTSRSCVLSGIMAQTPLAVPNDPLWLFADPDDDNVVLKLGP
jgi:hypothetical protein